MFVSKLSNILAEFCQTKEYGNLNLICVLSAFFVSYVASFWFSKICIFLLIILLRL